MTSSEPYTAPTVITLEAVPTAVVRYRGVEMDQLADLFEPGYQAVVASGAAIAGAAFALYGGDPSQAFDLELGFPLSDPLPAPVGRDPEVVPAQLPGGPALALTHFGSYDSLGESWQTLAAAAGPDADWSRYLEIYLTMPQPGVDPAGIRTDLVVFLNS